MKGFEKILNERYGLELESVDKGSIFASNEYISCVVISPYGATHDRKVKRWFKDVPEKWTVKFTTSVTLDNWAFVQHVVEQSVDTKERLFHFLEQHQSEIYLQLLKNLSSEYHNIEEWAEELKDNY